MIPNFKHESIFWNQGYHSVAGVDEVGRGSLAGPVVAAAVVFPRNYRLHHGIKDSKQLSATQRLKLCDIILKHATAWDIGLSSTAVINQLGIVPATWLAMDQALSGIKSVNAALIDGRDKPSLNQTFPITCQTIVKGDQQSVSIAAASIIAKVFRDALMEQISPQIPGYHWHKNKGYGTLAHCEAIKVYGPTKFHRLKFISTLV